MDKFYHDMFEQAILEKREGQKERFAQIKERDIFHTLMKEEEEREAKVVYDDGSETTVSKERDETVGDVWDKASDRGDVSGVEVGDYNITKDDDIEV